MAEEELPHGAYKIPVDPSDIYSIPDRLIGAWEQIGPEDELNIRLPRYAFDLMYKSIFHATAATAAVQRSLVAFIKQDMDRFNQQTHEAASESLSSQNDLKRWMAFVMSSATGLPAYDDENEGSSDG